MRYVLDTDVCIGVLRGREPVRSRLAACSPADLAVSSMTVAELRYGALNSRDPDGDTARVEAFLAPIEVLSFDRDAARRHAELRYALRHQPIGERDLVIASVAVARQLTLVTRNQREFGRIAELSLEDWTEA